ncbi:hypothetical protein [Flavobacterium taihuense]|uniref:Uncharacterized protein n=1 Tax=Flavobacterium taihuense TaxID=2857508 RepID=A0ABS6XTA2_9FLAO|nr:hypothetical protein [Flavobacterium taihuense]MBW4359907.1 hypothetical protein [Flavobacterium taihuense]
MKIIIQINQNHSKRLQFFTVVFFVFFLSSTVFSQKTNIEGPCQQIAINRNDIVSDNVPVRVLNSNVNFILWFMGTKEGVNSTLMDDGVYSKKSIITSGREPNRLLLKTLLKKTINIKSC